MTNAKKLSRLQRFILSAAYVNRQAGGATWKGRQVPGFDLFYPDILQNFFGITLRAKGRNGYKYRGCFIDGRWHMPVWHEGRTGAEAACYNRACASTTRALQRLEQRRLVVYGAAGHSVSAAIVNGRITQLAQPVSIGGCAVKGIMLTDAGTEAALAFEHKTIQQNE